MAASAVQFGRVVQVVIGPAAMLGVAITDLHVQFSVKRSLKKSANTATISLWNVGQAVAALLEQTGCVVTLSAGYGFIPPPLLFRGDIVKSGLKVERRGPDVVTTIEAGDAENALTEARFDQSFAAGTPNSVILSAILATMGCGLAPGDPLPPFVYPDPQPFSGLASRALASLCQDVGCEYSIQDGNVQILAWFSTRKDEAVLVSSLTGMIGSPSKTKGKGKSGASLSMLLNPSVKPGSVLSLAALDLQGFFRADSVEHRGDNRSGEWVTKVEASALGAER